MSSLASSDTARETEDQGGEDFPTTENIIHTLSASTDTDMESFVTATGEEEEEDVSAEQEGGAPEALASNDTSSRAQEFALAGNAENDLSPSNEYETTINDDREHDTLSSTENEHGTEEYHHGATNEQSATIEIANNNIQQFLAQHERWRTHVAILEKETTAAEGRPNILAAMYNDKQVILHSLKTRERNGQIGKVVLFSSERDRFQVRVDSTLLYLRALNLDILEKVEKEVKKEQMTSDKLVESLFRPGMLFVGTIQIPGLQGPPGRKEYQLCVDSCSTMDEMGQPTGILARHNAYDDEQFVWIQVEKEASDDETFLSIRYADGETQCRGKWNCMRCQFEGTVRQLLPTEDGGSIYHTLDEVTHTFTLCPSTALYPNGIASILDTGEGGMKERKVDGEIKELHLRWEQDLQSDLTKSIAKHRRETYQFSLEVVDQFRQVSRSIDSWREHGHEDSNSEEIQNLMLRLVIFVSWRDMLIAESLAAEKTCAKFRRWAHLLDSTSFASVEERTAILANLQDGKVTRTLAHAESDERKESSRDIFEAWATLSSLFSRSATRPNSEDMTRILIMCTRLDRNFARFDGALRRAQERLTDADIGQWIVPLPSRTDGGTGGETLCTICHVELEEEDIVGDGQVLCLPCSHSFHNDCLRKWLHHHSQCPVCRLELRLSV